ncbi:3-dehydroquinate synthase [Pseudenhygromyxa sp. WMMC2535]|uniref:3-dehydroquinate synthase n=1 Tax=Pseudenhygromyxa sp. WMMC2535 TaxID=2712867 RepID=UPI0015579D8F|nr:3-dehydroquinate synthase [Pseudenhygromyxa sp. WMMC2535]NVB38274.1 3-dehydroquinate synthase [Pseudenhygromyxa sp. WMMC2535]
MTTDKRKPIALHVAVPTEDESYPVLIGPGLLARLGHELRRSHPKAARVALVSDENVMPLYGDAARESLEAEALEVHSFTIPAGEAAKNLDQLVTLLEGMIAARMGRRDVVVALGGGVVGDLAGLAAALFMRGIPLMQCPTSLLAQVDASVGGKVAVDLPAGKNLIGSFHFPTVVIIDPEVLQTLPEREFACGLAEALKHGALFSPEHFQQVVAAADDIYARDADVLGRIVAASVALKAACVSRDPREQGEAGKGRVVLNLGHTLGHAIETVSGFSLKHGEAVSLGMIAAARLSERKKLAPKPEDGPGLEAQMRVALAALRLPTDLDAWLDDEHASSLEAALVNDKKRSFTSISYIALTRVGDPAVLSLTAQEIVALLRDPASDC